MDPVAQPGLGRTEGGVDVDAHPHRGDGRLGDGSPHLVDDVEVGHGVDHHGDLVQRSRLGEHPGQRRTVETRIADDDVADAAGVEDERLGHGVGEHPGAGGMGQSPIDGRRHPQRFSWIPIRQPASTLGQGVEVRVEGVEVDHCSGGSGSVQRTPKITRYHDRYCIPQMTHVT